MSRPTTNHGREHGAEGEAARVVTGTVESIVFRSEESGYTVCSVDAAGHRDPVTVVGVCAALWIGETIRAEGEWTRHPQHGYQFKADTITCVVPTSTTGIEKFLGSGLVHGIGKVMAERLVRAFGTGTLRVIEEEPERLREVEGIGPKRCERISQSWIEQKAVRDIMIFLQGHGVGTAQAARIYRHYKHEAIGLVSDNPYRLCADIWGIGFKTADRVAMSIGIPRESEVRARAGLGHVLQTMTDEGHCFCTAPELILHAQALLEIPAEILTVALGHEIAGKTLVKDGDRVYLAALHEAERYVAEKLKLLLATQVQFRPIVVEKAVPWAEERMRLRFAPSQAEALRTALSHKVAIITGGPGVGKTTIIRALVDVYNARRLQVCLAAPTGRAAKRMEEATRHEAKTLHRMLKFVPTTGRFDHGPENPLEGDVFILDEVSMVDVALMHHFLAALPPHCCLVLVGDRDQLPSVGPGNVLRDLIESGVIPCRTLDTIFRQESGGWIVRNAHLVNQGKALDIPHDAASDFYFIDTTEPDQVIQRVLELATDRIPRRFGFDPLADIQVLTPMRRNQLGAENLNAVLQQALNPLGEEIERFGKQYRVGDRVMQTRNNYDKDVFNGDIGRIRDLRPADRELRVDFDGRMVTYDAMELDELVHAYACSIHKSQGSEYPAVIILMTTQHFKLLQRNLLYTALTRGRQLVCLVGSTKAVGIAIRNNEIRLRRTGLRQRLADGPAGTGGGSD